MLNIIHELLIIYTIESTIKNVTVIDPFTYVQLIELDFIQIGLSISS